MNSLIPCLYRFLIKYRMNGFLLILISGFGTFLVISPNLDPKPPAKLHIVVKP